MVVASPQVGDVASQVVWASCVVIYSKVARFIYIPPPRSNLVKSPVPKASPAAAWRGVANAKTTTIIAAGIFL